MRRGRTGRLMRVRTATAREVESTAAPTALTEPCPTTSPPSAAPAVTRTESPRWICAACVGLTSDTASSAAPSTTSTSDRLTSTVAPGDEDRGDRRGAGRREAGEMARRRGHDADGGHAWLDRLQCGYGRSHAPHRRSRGTCIGGGGARLALPAAGGER